MKDDFRSLVLAVLLSFLAIYVVNYTFGLNKPQSRQRQIAGTSQSLSNPESSSLSVDRRLMEQHQNSEIKETDQIISEEERLIIKNASVNGSIRLKGARFDNVYLQKYNVELNDDSKKIELLSPLQTKNPYFIDLGWLSTDTSVKMPSSQSVWSTHNTELTPNTPVYLHWDNTDINITRKISLDENYLFTIEDTIDNNSSHELNIFPYALISRNISGYELSRSVVHEGISAIIDDKLKEFKYSDLKEGKAKNFETQGGWLGFSDRYWFTALVLPKKENAYFSFTNNGHDNYQIDYRGSLLVVPSHHTATYTYTLFVGAKEIKLLDTYTKRNGIDKFDLAVDFGWYYFLTKPFFYILDFLYGFLGNMGWAILLFAAILRLLLFPIANKSFTSMAKMKALQPKLMEIREKYGDNQMLIQQATMDLYKKEKINPAAGCLPMFIQIPVFFSLYKVLNISIEIRHAPFIGWIQDLSAPDPLTISQLTHIYIPGFLDIGLWPIFMGLTMWMQQKLNPAPTNKDQARMFALMPVFFTFMLGHFASGLIIYWTLSNLLSIIQQKAIMHKNGVK